MELTLKITQGSDYLNLEKPLFGGPGYIICTSIPLASPKKRILDVVIRIES